MKYIASVRNKETKERMTLEHEYPTKKAYRRDLIGNGYTVYFITTEENFDRDCEAYNERYELQKRIQKAHRDTIKELANHMNMTVAEYKAWTRA